MIGSRCKFLGLARDCLKLSGLHYQRRACSTVYDPPYLDQLKPEIELCEPFNIQITGPDFALVERWKHMFMQSVATPHEYFIVRQDEVEETTTKEIFSITGDESIRGSLAFLMFSSEDRTALIQPGREFLRFQHVQQRSTEISCRSPYPVDSKEHASLPRVVARSSSPSVQLTRDLYNEAVVNTSEDLPVQLTLKKEPQIHGDLYNETEVVIPSNGTSEDLTVLLTFKKEPQIHGSSMEQEPLEKLNPKTNPLEIRRKQFCIFCKNTVAKLFKHLFATHSNEERVAQAINNEDPREKRRLLDKIRREGYAESAEGDVCERLATKHPNVRCSSCGVCFSKITFHRHYQKCTGKKGQKNVVSVEKTKHQFMKTPDIKMSQRLKEVIQGMKLSDEMFEAITKDETVVRFGENQCLRYRDELTKQKNLIRSRLRAVATVRLECTCIDGSIKCVMDLMHPTKFETFVEAVSRFAKMDGATLQEKSPNNVHRVGLLFSGIAKDEKAYCLPDKDGRELKEKIACWIEVFERKFRSTLGWHADKVAAKKKWSGQKLVPLASDVLKLNLYLKEEIAKSLTVLKKHFNEQAWERLNKASMTLLMAFNRKRVGEMMTITIEDYKTKKKIREGTDIYKSLSPSEKISASRFYHLIIRGKLARPVPLLISNEIAGAIDVILKYRQEAGVTPDNIALFAKKDRQFDANIAMREATFACGAESPSDITSTALRKHIASVTQAINMNDAGVQVLCSFLGHTKQTHMEHYRLPSDAVNAARLSRLLTAFDEGTIGTFKNQSFEEIEADVEVYDNETVPRTTSVAQPTPGPSHIMTSDFPLQPLPSTAGHTIPDERTTWMLKRSRTSSTSSESSEELHCSTPVKHVPDVVYYAG